MRFFSMVKKMIKKSSVYGLFCLIFISGFAWSEVIQFPDQELAEEYVFPVFKNPKAVLNRDVTLTNRFELRMSGALRTDEPFYNPFSASASFSFYWNESHGLGLSALFFLPGLSKTGETLKAKEGISKAGKPGEVDAYYDAGLAPHPFIGTFLNYQFSPFYGKISITKTLVFNFALYSFFGLGTMGLKHGQKNIIMTPASHFGIGQRFYFNRYFALDGGIDFLVYHAPNPVHKGIKWAPDQKPPSRPKYSAFEKDIFLRFLARVGITILL